MGKKEINGVEINGKSIITSLKIIKQVCEDNINASSGCSNCPFFINENGYCGIMELSPDNWKILEYTKFQALG